MERFLWILTYVPARILVICLAVGDFFAYALMDPEYHIGDWLATHATLVCVIIAILLICSIVLAVIGGKLGYKYVELQRSRHWHYRATPNAGRSNKLDNTLYWAGKFSLFPLILVMSVFFMIGCVYFLKDL